MANYNINKGGTINIGKQISIDARGMSDEQLLRMIDQVVNNDDKTDIEIVEAQTSVETAEVTETRTVRVTMPLGVDTSIFERYMPDPSKAGYTRKWLHAVMDGVASPKEKLKPLRGLVKCKALSDILTHKDYVEEFGFMPKTTYSQWMKENASYKDSELEDAVKTYLPE